MEERFKQFKERVQAVVLTPAEKSAILERLNVHLEAWPPERVLFRFSFSRLTVLGVLVFVVVVSGLTVSAAERALPGDMLYPIKVNINEEARRLLAFSPVSKVVVETEGAVKRLQEVEKLVSQGKLDEPKIKDAETRLQKHAVNIQEQVGKLEAAKEKQALAEIAVKLENLAEARQKLAGETQAAPAESENLKPLLAKTAEIQAAIGSLVAESVKAGPDNGEEEQLLEAVEVIWQRMEEIEELAAPLGLSGIDNQLSVVKDLVAEGQKQLEARDVVRAAEIFSAVAAATAELDSRLSAKYPRLP